MNEKELLIVLNCIPDIGFIRFNNLIRHFGAVEKIFSATKAELAKVDQIGPKVSNAIISCDKDKILKDEMKHIEKRNVKAISCLDKDYPMNLKDIYDPPIILYVKGELTAEDRYSIGIVGSRHASRYGLQTAERLGCELAARGMTVVSGLARGIDAAGHKGALKAKGRTIAVLGSGLANIYPEEHAGLAEEISKNGAVVSEFPMAMEPYKDNFPRRNRIISGLSLGVVVVEAAKNSGALITTDFALEQGRELFAVPGQARAATAAGTNMLIRQGAKLVESADDVIEELGDVIKGHMKAERPEEPEHLPCGLGRQEEDVFVRLSGRPVNIDEIVDGTGLPVAEVMHSLTKLELKGIIAQLPGKSYVRKNS
ncbi:MAG: DNA-processing protein DprA [Candidatus Omnitrophica bacterium]|nr:DNA-processing protein DprA [Candidatus Omnitrophota bacterium]